MTTVNEDFGHLWDLKSFYSLRRIERRNQTPRTEQQKDIQKIFSNYRLLHASEAVKYSSALEYCQVNFVGPVPNPGLTYTTVADIIK